MGLVALVCSFVAETAAGKILGKKIYELYESSASALTGTLTEKELEKQTLDDIISNVRRMTKSYEGLPDALDTLKYFQKNYDSFSEKLANLDETIATKVAKKLGAQIDDLQLLMAANLVDPNSLPPSTVQRIQEIITENIDRIDQSGIQGSQSSHFDLNDIRQQSALFSSGTIDHYQTLSGQLRQGGFGLVIPAIDTTTKEKVALKFPVSSEYTDRLVYEAKVLTILRGLPNITEITNANFERKIPYIVMPYYEGPTLDSFINRSNEEKIRVAYNILKTIRGLHQRGLSHRDLKFDNIIVNGTNPTIIDYGSARKTRLTNIDLTTRQAEGSISTMDPDINLGNHDGDEKSDIYSFGSILYNLFTGNYFDSRLTEISKGIQTGDKTIDKIVKKCTRMTRTKRYDTVDETMKDFEKHYPHIVGKRKKNYGPLLNIGLKAATLVTIAGIYTTFFVAGYTTRYDVSPQPTNADIQKLESQIRPLREELQQYDEPLKERRSIENDYAKLQRELETTRQELTSQQQTLNNLPNLNDYQTLQTQAETLHNEIQQAQQNLNQTLQNAQSLSELETGKTKFNQYAQRLHNLQQNLRGLNE